MVVEEWKLNNPFVKSAKWGDLDYSNDELKQIDMVIRYDWASLEGAASNAASANSANAVPVSAPQAFAPLSTWNAGLAEEILRAAETDMPSNPNSGVPETADGDD